MTGSPWDTRLPFPWDWDKIPVMVFTIGSMKTKSEKMIESLVNPVDVTSASGRMLKLFQAVRYCKISTVKLLLSTTHFKS